jgi:raffinose/stachyose/melibiose transport system substrate-binding protein
MPLTPHSRRVPTPAQTPPGARRSSVARAFSGSSAQRAFSRRELLALGGGTAALAALTACAQGSATRKEDDAISLWASFNRNSDRQYYEKNIIQAFNADHDFKVNLTIKSGDSLERLQQTAIASGQGPDIVVTSGPSYALEYITADKLAPLDEYAEKGGWAEKLQTWAYDAGKVENKLYSIPTSFETMVGFVNKEVLDKYGWQAPTTRDEFESLCTEAKGQGLMPVLAGSAEWKPATEWHVSVFFNHFCGPEAVYSALKGETPWTDPVFVDAITLMNGYFQKGWFGGGVQEYFTNRMDVLNTKFAKGEVAYNIIGSWAFGDMRSFFDGKTGAGPEAWDWAPLPSFGEAAPNDLYTLSVGGTYSVNADSENPDQAAEYLTWLISDPERIAKAVADVAFQPFPLNFTPEDFPSNTDERIKRLYVDMAAAKAYGYVTWTFWPPKSDVFIYEEMDKVLTGKLTPKDYCAGLDEVFKEELTANKVPPVPPPAGG